MIGNIIQIGDFTVHREKLLKDINGHSLRGCKHSKITLDDNGDIVRCDDCKLQLGPYAALRMLVDQWSRLRDNLEAKRLAIIEASDKTIELRAAQIVEKAWRLRSMVPICPHCSEAIFPTDGFGNSLQSKEIANRRRAVKKARTPV